MKPELVTQNELEIKDVTLKEEKDGERITKAFLKTAQGWHISYKTTKNEKIVTVKGGFEVEKDKTDYISIEELPEILSKIRSICKDKGSCMVRCSYMVWSKEIDGVTNTYRFISKKQLEELQILTE